jgi:hypothetical protein
MAFLVIIYFQCCAYFFVAVAEQNPLHDLPGGAFPINPGVFL